MMPVHETQICDSHQHTTKESLIDDNQKSENQSKRGKKIRVEKDGDPEHDDDSDKWSEADELEEELHVNPGILDTMLTSPDFVESSERGFVFSFAPSEENIPLSVFLERNAEELSFPGIFCGQTRLQNKDREVPVTYSEIVRSELRNSDRRAASCVENIFFKTKKLQMKQLIDQTQIVMIKCKTKGKNLTAKDMKGDGAKEFVHTDKAYKFMKSSWFSSILRSNFQRLICNDKTAWCCYLLHESICCRDKMGIFIENSVTDRRYKRTHRRRGIKSNMARKVQINSVRSCNMCTTF